MATNSSFGSFSRKLTVVLMGCLFTSGVLSTGAHASERYSVATQITPARIGSKAVTPPRGAVRRTARSLRTAALVGTLAIMGSGAARAEGHTEVPAPVVEAIHAIANDAALSSASSDHPHQVRASLALMPAGARGFFSRGDVMDQMVNDSVLLAGEHGGQRILLTQRDPNHFRKQSEVYGVAITAEGKYVPVGGTITYRTGLLPLSLSGRPSPLKLEVRGPAFEKSDDQGLLDALRGMSTRASK